MNGDYFSASEQECRQRLDTEEKVVRDKRLLLMKILMRGNSEESDTENGGQMSLHHFTDFVVRQNDGPVAGPSNSSSGISHHSATEAKAGGGASNEPPSQPSIPQLIQQVGDGPWRDRVVAAIRRVLDRHGKVDGVNSMTEKVRAALGEEDVDDLAQHLVDTDSDLAVVDFVHRCLWDGFYRGL